ncbi:related to MDM31-Mitochondrial inner membrane protein required for mitochondrial morphology and inheritance [Serendipita indica DSM 11827]|uniref:Related to MDM31-Mitochondrial inner membrane protein required for mitochondrial morphology and inheritance n=1 Tax=Serendipita indica (strain DSM 11827) TaxID=1109443 RepID=G4TEY5_SERID|nr:related to MDM31-Mitochondrial inner membrane protein required for mitochondrial morphology and inheritance [Serendipita indica DSM 11827]
MLSRIALLEPGANRSLAVIARHKPNVEMRQRYLTIRSFFTSIDRAKPQSLHAITRHAKPKAFSPISLSRRAFMSSQITRSTNDTQSKTASNDAQTPAAHDKHPGTSQLKDQDKHGTLHTTDYPSYVKRLTSSLPPLHRPTKDEMLALANGFWERLRIRFKWFTIRGFRKFNTDDMSAFLSWIVFGQAVWILLGTTTFFSVVFATFNSLRMQEFVARKISDYLTRETGWTVVFESAIVPKWKDGKISFKKTYISRHPDLTSHLSQDAPKSPDSASHPAHTAATRLDVHHPTIHHSGEDDIEHFVAPRTLEIESIDELTPDQRITTFDLEVDSVDVELSLSRWLDGKGLVQNATIKGVRGVVDRRLISMDTDDLDPASFRHPNPGFELESLQLEDVLVTVYQPNFRPYMASIFQADFRLLRKQWLFYDLLSAKSIVGQFDNCLFSLHEPQSIGRTMAEDLKDTQWKRMSRFRIDGVNIDHLQAATGSSAGPISWITSGKVDAVLDIKFPRDASGEVDISSLINEIAHNISVATSSGESTPTDVAMRHMSLSDRIPGQRELAKPALRSPDGELEREESKTKLGVGSEVVIDIDLRFRDLKAAVPIFTKDLSYANNALVRPIVAFINANRTLIPIHCTVVKELSEFDGSWTAWETGLTDAIALQVYGALAYHVTKMNMNRRIKAVSSWSLTMASQAVISALRNIVDPISAQLRESSSDENLYFG